jgi:hypothetical protein
MSQKYFGLMLLFFCSALSVFPQTLSVRAGAGVLFPREDSYKKIYGNSFPLLFEAKVRVFKNCGFTAGLDWRSDKGKAWPLGEAAEEFPLRFKMISIPVSVFCEFPIKMGTVPVDAAFGLGISWNSYKENWETAELSHGGKTWGPLVYAAVDFRIVSRAGLFASLRWESVPTGQESPFGRNINLGGIKLLGGVIFYLF